jgi:hypothetical protein
MREARLQAFTEEIDRRARKFADLPYVHDHYELLKLQFTVRFLTWNHDLQLITDALTFSGRQR